MSCYSPQVCVLYLAFLGDNRPRGETGKPGGNRYRTGGTWDKPIHNANVIKHKKHNSTLVLPREIYFKQKLALCTLLS